MFDETETEVSAGTPLVVFSSADDVRAELARRRVTGQQVAQACGLSATMVSFVLAGTRRSSRVAAAVSRLLGGDASVLAALDTKGPRQGPPGEASCP